MKQLSPKEGSHVLGLAPSSRGFGFAVMDQKGTLLDWGGKMVTGDKNARSLSNVANLMTQYSPMVIVLEDTQSKGNRRRTRIRDLINEIADLAESEGIKVSRFSRKELKGGFLVNGKGTKHNLAELLASRFPEELAFRLPKKRRAWTSEDHRMDIFDAVALAEHFVKSEAMDESGTSRERHH